MICIFNNDGFPQPPNYKVYCKLHSRRVDVYTTCSRCCNGRYIAHQLHPSSLMKEKITLNLEFLRWNLHHHYITKFYNMKLAPGFVDQYMTYVLRLR